MFETLKKILVEKCEVNADDVTMDAELANDLNINSIELADLVAECEDEFGITISDDSFHQFVTVGDVVRYLEETQK